MHLSVPSQAVVLAPSSTTSGESILSRGAYGLGIVVRLQGLHRISRLRPPLGKGIVVVAFGKLEHRMPTNQLLVRIFCPVESVA